LNEKSGDIARVFFALWPDAEAAARLHTIAQQWHGSLGGRVTHADTLHATLVFVGDVETSRLPTLLESAADIQLPGFNVVFDRGGCWRHNHIAYLGMRGTPEALRNLQFTLASRVQEAGFAIEKRDYSPHITLIRKAVCANKLLEKENPATEPVAWTVRDFVLVRSSMSANGSRYEQIGRWPLLEDNPTS